MKSPRKRKKKAVAAAARRHRALYLAGGLALVVSAYFLWVHYRVLPPERPVDILPRILEEQGFTLNAGLSDLYQPGDVIQVADASGAINTPFLRGSFCFKDLEIEASDYALPVEMTSDASAALQVGGKGLGRFLPELGMENESVGRFRLELDRPRLLIALRGDLSRRFSAECVTRLRQSIDDGDRLEWFEVVDQAVVADGVRLQVETQTASSAEAKLAIDKSTRDALAPRGDLAVSDDGKTTKLYVLGRTVLAYKTRPLAPWAPDLPSTQAPNVVRADPQGEPAPEVGGTLRILAVDGRSTEAVGLDHLFHTGDWFRFAIRSDIDGWFYVFHRPPQGQLTQLWPPSSGSGSNVLVAGTELAVPPHPQGWEHTETTGDEYFYVALTSEVRLPAVAGAIEGPAEVVNYIVRGLSRNVGLGTVPDADSSAGTDEDALRLTASDGGHVAVVAFRLRHDL
jgi:hypothetical protein